MIIQGEVYYNEDEMQDILSDNDRLKRENDAMMKALRNITEIPPSLDENLTVDDLKYYIWSMIEEAVLALVEL